MAEDMILRTSLEYRGGRVESGFDGRPGVEQAGLSEMAEKPAAWTPPHMYVASVEGCFVLTMLDIAARMRVGIRTCRTSAEGRLVSPDGKQKEISEIVIRANVELEDEGNRPKLAKLFQMAEDHCLVARSIKTKVTIEP